VRWYLGLHPPSPAPAFQLEIEALLRPFDPNGRGHEDGSAKFIHIELTFRKSTDIPSRVEVVGSVMPG
jgi:hypothetical protein